ncbi:MAG: efflux RND transporter periplasmic adaptor subunit [Hyphomicrobiaceae bacterium]|nr:MAG: efflux RND transporter periplasmic adaptor subunit [Hyphomicrobiaceae bacterium]
MWLLKRTVSLAVIASVVAIVIFVTMMPAVQEKLSPGRRFRAGGEGPVPVLGAQARIADVPVHLNGVGTARARNTVTVRPQVDGRIISINFKEGQEVKRGDVLARIDPATYQAQLDQAIAKKALDEAQLANAKRDLERYSQLTTLSVAAKTIDTQRALVAQLTAQIKSDEAAIANARAVLDYTTIVAPIDGRTGIRLVDEGNLVRASDAGIVVLTEVRPISAVFTLPQQQLAQVNKALAAGPVTIEALDTDGKVVLDRGVLLVVDNQVDQTTGTVRMKGEFPNASMQLWPGQFVNVRILIDTLKQVVVVPTPAVQRGPSGTFAYVVRPDSTVTLRPITVAMQGETEAVIAKGIDVSEQVVTTGFARLKDGASVVVGAPEGQRPQSAPAPTAAKTDARASIRAACAADMQKFCAEVERSGMRACLQANAARLSEGCKAAAAGAKPREADARKAEGNSVR